MIAQEILARQLNNRLAAHAEYLAGLKKLENEYVVLKGLADGEAVEILKLQEKLAQLGGMPAAPADPPMHPLQAAIAQGGRVLQNPPAPMSYVPVAAPIPRGLGAEDMAHPKLQEIAPREGHQHMRQDPYGTIVQNVDQAGGIPNDVLPRGKIQGIEQPLITQDLQEGV